MKGTSVTTAVSQGREARRLSTLLEVSQALSGTLNLKSALHRVLEVLAKHHGAIRSMVTLLREGGELYVEASDGLDRPAQNVQYRMGEGITGRVVETAKPIVVPRVSREPTMLNRAARRSDGDDQEISFVCVPVVLNRRAVGALGVDMRYKAERDFDSSVKFFGVVATMCARRSPCTGTDEPDAGGRTNRRSEPLIPPSQTAGPDSSSASPRSLPM